MSWIKRRSDILIWQILPPENYRILNDPWSRRFDLWPYPLSSPHPSTQSPSSPSLGLLVELLEVLRILILQLLRVRSRWILLPEQGLCSETFQEQGFLLLVNLLLEQGSNSTFSFILINRITLNFNTHWSGFEKRHNTVANILELFPSISRLIMFMLY